MAKSLSTTLCVFSFCLTASAAASDLCIRANLPGFPDEKISNLCQKDVARLLKKPLSFTDNRVPLRVNDVEMITCADYLAAGPIGTLSFSRMEEWTESIVYVRNCAPLSLLQRAKKPKASFLGKDPLDFKILPPTILYNGPTGDDHRELEDALSRGESAEDFLQSLEKKNQKFNRKEFLDGLVIEVLGRADFDSDGYEEALILVNYSDPDPDAHYSMHYTGILKRESPNGPAQFIHLENFNK